MGAEARPGRRIASIDRPFFEGSAQGDLLLPRCRAAGCCRHVNFPRVCCPYRGGGGLEWREASGRGRVARFTIVHRPQHPSYLADAPYVFAAIELEEGLLMYSRIEGVAEPDAGLIGQNVSATFAAFGADRRLPHFRVAP